MPAVDNLVLKLRENLGESLAQIKSNSAPLESVTTSNIDALRAYSLANQANGRGNYHLALDLLHHALGLDPNFAAAYAAEVSNYLMLRNQAKAQEAIDHALHHADRLSPIERLKLHAKSVTIHESKVAAAAAWKMLADLYPDDASGANNTGPYYAAYLNDCTSALPYLRHASNLPQALQPISVYTMATCQLATGNNKRPYTISRSLIRKDSAASSWVLPMRMSPNAQYEKASDFLANIAKRCRTPA